MVSFRKKNSSSKMFKGKMTSKSKLFASTCIDNSTSSGSDISSIATVEPPPTIAGLIGNRKWSLLDALLMDGTPLISIDDPALAEHAITENIVLHFALRFQAPLRTVSLLSKLYSSSITSPDASGRYPIHVACKWSSTPDVINYLVRLNSSACGVQDNFGKTPMHYVAEFYVANYQLSLERLYPMDESMMEVLKLLKTAAPASVNLEDNEGCNAIEYALENDVHVKVIKSMQRACRDDWRQRSKNSDDGLRRRHSDLMQDLEELTLNLQEELKSGGGGKDLEFVHSVLTESQAASIPRRRGSMVKISNGRVHVDDPSAELHKPTTAAARTA
jgi:hypothetical protein